MVYIDIRDGFNVQLVMSNSIFSVNHGASYLKSIRKWGSLTKKKHVFIISGLVLVVCILVVVIISQMLKQAGDASGIMTVASAPSESSDATVPAVQDASADAITIRLGVWPEPSQTDAIKLHEGYVAKLKELHPDITVLPAPYTLADMDHFMAAAQSETLPTVFEFILASPDSTIPFDYVADITDELAARGWDKAMNPGIKDMLSKDGRIYGIPLDGYALGLMMNLDLFKQAGLVNADGRPLYPKTIDEFVECVQKIKKETGKAGFCFPAKDMTGSWHFAQIAWNFGATLCSQNSDGTFTANLDSAQAIEAMSFIKDLKWKYDVLTETPAEEDWNTGFTALGKGDAAMYIAASDVVNQVTQVNGLSPDKLALCAFPAGPKGDAYCLTSGNTYAFAKNATPDEISACLDYLEIMGKAPVATDDVIAGLKTDAQDKKANGIPILPRFPLWVNKDYLDAENTVIRESANVDMEQFQPYFDAVTGSGYTLRMEEPGSLSSLYLELVPVLQAVVTDKNADVQALMEKADSNLQQILNEQYPQ